MYSSEDAKYLPAHSPYDFSAYSGAMCYLESCLRNTARQEIRAKQMSTDAAS